MTLMKTKATSILTRTSSNDDKYNDDIDGNDDDVFTTCNLPLSFFTHMQTIGADMHSLPGDPRQRLILIDIHGTREGTADVVPSQGSHNMVNFPEQTVADTW